MIISVALRLVDDAQAVEVVHGGEEVPHPLAGHGQRHGGLPLEQAVDVDQAPLHHQHCAARAGSCPRFLERNTGAPEKFPGKGAALQRKHHP